MADNVAITAGSGTTIAADEVTDGTLGSAKVQYVKLMDGTLDGTTKAAVGANGLAVDVKAMPSTTVTATHLDIRHLNATDDIVQLGASTAAIGKLAANDGVDIGNVDVASLPSLPTGSNAIGKLAANSGVDIGDVDVLSLPALTVDKGIQWSHYSNEYTTTQTSTDLVALSGSTKFYIGRLTIGTGGTTAGLVTVYFGTGAYSAGTSKTVFRGNFAPSSTVYPGVVIGNGSAPFCISAAGDALKITTSAGITVYVQVDYIRV